MPRPTLAPQTEVACTRAGPGAKTCASRARPQARIAAPPTPSSTRAAMKSTGSCATAQISEPSPSAASPATYTRRRPNVSPSTPVASRAAARPTLIELRIQARATAPAPRSAAVAGMVAIGVT